MYEFVSRENQRKFGKDNTAWMLLDLEMMARKQSITNQMLWRMLCVCFKLWKEQYFVITLENFVQLKNFLCVTLHFGCNMFFVRL